ALGLTSSRRFHGRLGLGSRGARRQPAGESKPAPVPLPHVEAGERCGGDPGPEGDGNPKLGEIEPRSPKTGGSTATPLISTTWPTPVGLPPISLVQKRWLTTATAGASGRSSPSTSVP